MRIPNFLTYTNVYLPLDRGLVQWRVVPVISRIRISTVSQQELDDFRMPKGTRIVQWNQSAVVASMDISATLQQVFYHIFSTKSYKRRNEDSF